MKPHPGTLRISLAIALLAFAAEVALAQSYSAAWTPTADDMAEINRCADY